MANNRFAQAAKDFCQRHQKIPGYLWFGGTTLFTFLGGYSHAINQMIAGGFEYASEAMVAGRGGKKYGYALASTLSTISYTAWQLPHLKAGEPEAIIGYTLATVSNLPVIAEPWLQERAQKALVTFREEGTTLTQKTITKVKKSILQTFANPRPFWSICHASCLLPPAIYDARHHHVLMLPVYLLWYSGDLVAGLTRPATLPNIQSPSNDIS